MGATAFLAATLAVPGVAIGSFLNVVVSRVPLRLPIGTSRSRCMSCSIEIAARDNVPLLSYLLLRGRCRSCGSAIPWRYPAVEALTAVLVAFCGAAFGLTPRMLGAALFCALLVTLSAIEIEHGLVPDRVVVGAAGAALVVQTVLHPSARWAASGLAAALLLSVCAVVRPISSGVLGLAVLMGAVLGPSAIVALVCGYAVALALVAVLSVRSGSTSNRLAGPLVPCLALGSITVLFAGGSILPHAGVGF